MRKYLLLCFLVITVSLYITNITAQTEPDPPKKPCPGSQMFQMPSACPKDSSPQPTCFMCSLCEKCKAKMMQMCGNMGNLQNCGQKGPSQFSCMNNPGGNPPFPPPAPPFADRGGKDECCKQKQADSSHKSPLKILLAHKDMLGLTQAQIEKIKTIALKTQQEVIQTKASIDIEELDVKMIMDDDDIDMAALKSKLESIAKKNAKLRLLKAEAKMSVKSVLTPEQIKQFKEIKSNCMCPMCAK
ncbi:MAG: hypothetical protein A2161_17330 [Candidatus Schekmanbacteria bacterium RBG_13_48_7]|uniref:Uncharacterized protein n=1 Tax=Candidatus Schekmanbacteria bacterium RBG_13_48_7 TaxID=1817878 RepID=A0A1F7RML9_9BACT|nr:MAG: hypothetical protein A2161_17330 [Candidatus Schekmanbacteria bacterium RBG_13_48_7]